MKEINYNRKIDVIIPVYNTPDDILFRCLSSIACQDIINDIEVTIVDDASTVQNYQKVADIFKDYLKINILRYKTNKGPGVARQYGLDNTSNEYIIFIDSDDTFNSSISLKLLRDSIEVGNGLYYIAVGNFDEILERDDLNGNKSLMIVSHSHDPVFLFGKLYRRSFINKYNIRFHESSRSNEDGGFNALIRLCAEDHEMVTFVEENVYIWHYNHNSITRINDCEFTYGSSTKDCLYGFVENMIFAIKGSLERNPNSKDKAIHWAAYCMIFIYSEYLACYSRSRNTLDGNFKWCKKFYDEVYKQVEEEISEDIIAEEYSIRMNKIYIDDSNNDIIPFIGFYEFLDKLKNYKE